MRTRKAFLFAVAFIAAAAAAALEAAAGSILSLSGEVRIDAFGRGSFIPALAGDSLYRSSVIATGATGQALLRLGGQEIALPPGSRSAVAELLKLAERKKSLSFFKPLAELIRAIGESAGGREDLSLGTRAAEAGAQAKPEWYLEDSAESLYREASEQLEKGEYHAALATLARAAAEPGEPLFVEIRRAQGSCHFALDSFGEAELAFADAAKLVAASGGAAYPDEIRSSLLFELGASRFMLGKDAQAAASLEASLAGLPEPLAPHAHYFLIKALYASGNARGAAQALDRARATFKGGPYAERFALGLDEL